MAFSHHHTTTAWDREPDGKTPVPGKLYKLTYRSLVSTWKGESGRAFNINAGDVVMLVSWEVSVLGSKEDTPTFIDYTILVGEQTAVLRFHYWDQTGLHYAFVEYFLPVEL